MQLREIVATKAQRHQETQRQIGITFYYLFHFNCRLTSWNQQPAWCL